MAEAGYSLNGLTKSRIKFCTGRVIRSVDVKISSYIINTVCMYEPIQKIIHTVLR